MLLSYVVTSASQAKDYFATSVSPGVVSSRQDYYSEGQESPGSYSGKLAVELGLAGKAVDAETFYRLCDNRHPTKAKSLTPRTNEHRRIFYDFTVSGPKSFSIIEAFAPADEQARLRRAFDEAIDETLAADIEPDMQTRVRKAGANHDVATGNVLAVKFPHATARPEKGGTLPDMHWHTHLLIWNATLDADGKIKAGQFGNMVRDKPYYRAAFYARLAEKLESLGYAIDRRGDTDWEIAGVPQRVIDLFSKRTKQIEAEAERRGITDEAEKAGLGAKIRSKKQKELTLAELRQAWAEQLTDDERDALAKVHRKDIAADKPVTASEAVGFALAHLSEKHSVFPERELMRVALLHGLGHVTPEQVAAELPKHGVLVDDIDGRRMATTEALQEEERFMVGLAARGKGAVRPVGVSNGLTRALPDGRMLTAEQWAVAKGLLESSCTVDLFEGPAGAGKSFSLQKYDEGVRLAGEKVAYLATTAKAVGVLEEDGFAVSTVARFLLDEKMQANASGGRLVIDEASMLGHKDAVKLFAAVCRR
jgi:conjugative relaxase-like TrwC/TraI family protein